MLFSLSSRRSTVKSQLINLRPGIKKRLIFFHQRALLKRNDVHLAYTLEVNELMTLRFDAERPRAAQSRGRDVDGFLLARWAQDAPNGFGPWATSFVSFKERFFLVNVCSIGEWNETQRFHCL